jgi:hypothetical protein
MDQREGSVQEWKILFVCIVKKDLYMLKGSPRAWYHHIDSILIYKGLCRSPTDDSLYIKQIDEYSLVIILYVHDWSYWQAM